MNLLEALPVLNQYALSKALAMAREQTKAAYLVLANFHQHLEEIKKSRRVITFADIALRLGDWFKSKDAKLEEANKASQAKEKSRQRSLLPELDEAVSPYEKAHHLSQIDYRNDARIDHLLLDEFQDTAPVQWDILRPFAEAVTRSRGGQPTSFFCVGDVKQAIYGWRGGVAELFRVVKEELLGVRESSLDVSFRSSPVVIQFVNQIFKNLTLHKNFGDADEAAKLFSGAFKEHETARENLPGYIRLTNLPKSTAESYGDSTDEDEDSTSLAAKECVRDVVTLHRQSPDTTIGILVRTNAELGPLMHLLREQQVDASQEGGNPLTDSAAVELILSAIQLADHPGDRVAYFHLFSSPLAEYARSIAWNWNQLDIQTNDVDTGIVLHLEEPDSKRQEEEDIPVIKSHDRKSNPFRRNSYDERLAHLIARAIRSHLDSRGYGNTIAAFAEQLSPFCSSRDQQRLDQLIQSAYRYEAISSLRSRDFNDFIRSDRVALSKLPAPVRIMTIHQSKGLEFDAVFLPGLYKKFVSGKIARFVTSQSNPLAPPISVLRYVNSALQEFLSEEWKGAFNNRQSVLTPITLHVLRCPHKGKTSTLPVRGAKQTTSTIIRFIAPIDSSSRRKARGRERDCFRARRSELVC